MKNVIEWLKGKKSYIIAIVTGVLGALQAMGLFTLPDYAYVVLAGAFGITLRAGVAKVAESLKGEQK